MSNTRERLSRLRQRIGQLMRERNRLEEKLLRSPPLLEGSLIEQYRSCGKSGCRCQRGERHGPYPYLVVGKGEKRRLRYVSVKDYKEIKKRARASQEFARHLAGLSRLNRDIRAGFKELRQVLLES